MSPSTQAFTSVWNSSGFSSISCRVWRREAICSSIEPLESSATCSAGVSKARRLAFGVAMAAMVFSTPEAASAPSLR